MACFAVTLLLGLGVTAALGLDQCTSGAVEAAAGPAVVVAGGGRPFRGKR